MVGTDTAPQCCPRREVLFKMMEEKNKIENELREQNAILQANNVGMFDPLVDAEGYPRNDIDVYKVRHARHRIICLKNDVKDMIKIIEENLVEVFSPNVSTGENESNGDQGQASHSNSSGNNPESSMLSGTGQCFAEVGNVQLGSPADLAGLMENDQLLEFGSINHNNYTEFGQIRDVLMHSVGQPVHVRVKRGHNVVNINLVPRPWERRGLLGCEIREPSQSAL